VKVMTMFDRICGTRVRVTLAGVLAVTVLLAAPSPAMAQDDPNPGALTFTGGLDIPTIYFFRGIRQETDPKLTAWPYGDIGLALFSGDGGIKSVAVNFGVWNSLHTGTSGTGGSTGLLHYEEDFYATLGLGFGGGVNLGTTFTAYTSPNSLFRTVKEISFKVSKTHMLAPYGLVAFELGGDNAAGADGGSPGTYVEVGVGPSWALAGGAATLAVPVKVGLNVTDYYHHPLTGEDHHLGFFDVGGLLTIPLKGVPSRFGTWNVHAGVDLLVLGESTKAFNVNKDGEINKNQVIGLFGIGVGY
jgi:hypothetical protein